MNMSALSKGCGGRSISTRTLYSRAELLTRTKQLVDVAQRLFAARAYLSLSAFAVRPGRKAYIDQRLDTASRRIGGRLGSIEVHNQIAYKPEGMTMHV